MVDTVKKYRKGYLEAVNTLSPPKKETRQSGLKENNVDPEIVVEVINEHREEVKYEMLKFEEKFNPAILKSKVEQLEKLFSSTGNEMEWELINIEAERVASNSGFDVEGSRRRQIISMVESSDVVKNLIR